MITRTETLIIGAAIALAMVPRIEARVEQYAATHRTEIQMAMNELQGKPAVPFAAPDAATDATPIFALASNALSFDQEPMDVDLLRVRAQVAAVRPTLRAATHMQLAQVRAQAAALRAVAAPHRAMLGVYRVRAQRCPVAPAAPSIPQPVRFLEDSGS